MLLYTLQRGYTPGTDAAQEHVGSGGQICAPPSCYPTPHTNQAFHAVVSLPTDYTVSLDITPTPQVQTDWGCIIHFTATGDNCERAQPTPHRNSMNQDGPERAPTGCAYGDRAPAIWFHPGTHDLVIVDGQPGNGNALCNPADPLQVNIKSTISVDIGAGFYQVTINGVQVCDGLRKDRRTFQTVHVWAGDPFYEPAYATIENFYMQPNQPRAGCMINAACNRDFKANRPDGSCIYPRTGFGCNNQPLQVDGSTGVTQFVPQSRPVRLVQGLQGARHDIVYMALDARIQFDLTPDPGVSESWGSIFHFTATGNNCCDYGDRVPAVWFYPASHRLHIVHGGGTDGDGNNDCSPEEELPARQVTTVRIDVRQTHVEVYYNNMLRCTEPRSQAKAWSPVHMLMADPWHTPGMATIGNFLHTCRDDGFLLSITELTTDR